MGPRRPLLLSAPRPPRAGPRARPGSSSDPGNTNRRRLARPRTRSLRLPSPRLLLSGGDGSPGGGGDAGQRTLLPGVCGPRAAGRRARGTGPRGRRILTPCGRRRRHFRVALLHVDLGNARGGAGRGRGVRGQRLPGCRGDRGRATRAPSPGLGAWVVSRWRLGPGRARGSEDVEAYTCRRGRGAWRGAGNPP